jgi:hypothetical protein
MELAPQAVETETRFLLRLEAPIEVELRIRPGREELRQRGDDEHEDRQDDDQLDERVSAPAPH